MYERQKTVRQNANWLMLIPKMLRMLCTGLGIGLIAWVGNAGADEAVRHYRIPAQALDSGLLRLAADSGLEILFTADKVRGITGNTLDGSMTPAQGLSRLLQGTGMTYRFVDAKTVTVEAPDANFVKTAATSETQEPQSSGGEMMPKVTVEADSENPYDGDPNWSHDPNNKDYFRPKTSTATKIERSMMETPHSVQVAPRQLIEDRKITTIEEFTDNISGVQRLNWENGMSQYIIRGFFESRDRLYNGFREFNNSGPTDVSNIERVEVLKGPSAMLYGGGLQNSGVVNMVTKKPLDYTYNHGDFTAGSYDFYRARIDSAGALTDDKSLQYRLNLSYKNAGSFKDFISDENYFIAPNILWKISDRDTLDFKFEYNKFNYAYDSGLWVDNFNTLYKNLPLSRNLSEPNQFNEGSTYRVTYDYQHQFNDDWKFRQGFMTSQYEIEFGANKLSYASPNSDGVTLARSSNYGPQSTASYDLQNELYGKFETWGIKHDFLSGIELFSGSYGASRYTSSNYVNTNFNPFNPIYGNDSRNITGIFHSDEGIYNVGIYVQDLMDITDKLKLSFGGRYDFFWTRNAFNSIASPLDYLHTYDNEFSPRVGLLYQVADSTSLYANWGNSFYPNGYSRNKNGESFKPAESEQFEVGMKNQFFNGRLTSTMAGYVITKKNNLTRDLSVIDETGSFPFQIALGEQQSRGFEWDLAGEPLPGWQMIATYAYTNTEVTKDNNPDLVGKRLYSVPLNSVSFWSSYEIQSGLFKGLKGGVGVYYNSQRYADLNNTVKLGDYVRLDAMVSYPVTKHVKLALNLKNLNDERYFDSDNGWILKPSAPFTALGTVEVDF